LGIEQLYDRLRRDMTNKGQRIIAKLHTTADEEMLKEGAREGVERLLELNEGGLAHRIVNLLTGFAF